MALSPVEKNAYMVCLVLTLLLTGLHFAVAGAGHEYYKADGNPGVLYVNGTNYSQKDFNNFAAFLIIAAGLTFFCSIILLVGYCTNRYTAKFRHVLASFNLILEFAIAVAVSIAASTTSNLRDLLYTYRQVEANSSLDLYYRLLIADAVITFTLEVLYLVVIYLGSLREVEHYIFLAPLILDPPITADRLQ